MADEQPGAAPPTRPGGGPPWQPGISRQFDALLDAIPDTLVYLSPDLTVLWANRAAAEKLGRDPAEIVGRRCHEVWHSRGIPCEICPVQATFASGQPEAREITDPAGLVWDLRSAPVRGDDGSVAGVIELARDVTAQRRLEGQLAHARKLEAVGRLAGGVAHDFNNYLAAISGFSDLALLEIPAAAPGRESVEQIRAAALAAGSVTRQLLAFSRRQPFHPRPVELKALIERRAGMLRQLAGEECRLELQLAGDLGMVIADPGQFEQTLVNLVVNAREAMPFGGTISVSAENLEFPERSPAHPADLQPGRYVAVVVHDNGVGVSDEARTRIFEPFYTTKEAGTGLGLATVADFVRQAGGGVRLQSAAGQGTRVEILLPRAAASPSPEPAAPPAQEGARRTVLVVEDQPPVRRVVAQILRLQGHTVLEAGDAAEALAVAAAHPRTIDLLLTDIVMPGMRGPELARRLRDDHRGLAVLYMSGYFSGEAATEAGETPQPPMLRKPFTAEALAQAVCDALAG